MANRERRGVCDTRQHCGGGGSTSNQDPIAVAEAEKHASCSRWRQDDHAKVHVSVHDGANGEGREDPNRLSTDKQPGDERKRATAAGKTEQRLTVESSCEDQDTKWTEAEEERGFALTKVTSPKDKGAPLTE
jgi:hypothetical protein